MYYFKHPNRSSKGFIPLADATGLCLLPHRPETEPVHRGHIPVVICTSKRVWMLAFDNLELCQSFVKAMQEYTDVQIKNVIIEDWAMVQPDKLRRRWIRNYLVYIGSGDLLYFSDGATTEFIRRMRMVDVQRVIATFDGARGNGMLSPKSQRERTVEQCLQLMLKDEIITLEFDSQAQYDKWKVILVDASAGDIGATHFLRMQRQAETRKKLERRRRTDKLRRRQKASKKKKNRSTISDVDSVISESSTRSQDSTSSRRSSKKRRNKKKTKEKMSEPPPLPLSLPPSPIFESKMEDIVVDVDPLLGSEIKVIENETQRSPSWRRRRHRRFKSPDVSRDSFQDAVPSRDEERSQKFSFRKKSNRDSLDEDQGIPLMDIETRRSNGRRFRGNSVDRILQRGLSNEFEKTIVDAGLNELHDDLQKNFSELKEQLHKSTKTEERLQNQVEACAQAIETLGQLLPRPVEREDERWDSGDWYTKEPPGGYYVRHWVHRTDRLNG